MDVSVRELKATLPEHLRRVQLGSAAPPIRDAFATARPCLDYLRVRSNASSPAGIAHPAS